MTTTRHTSASNGTASAADDHPLHRLTPEQIEELGAEFQKIHDDVFGDLGERDGHYIRSIVQFHRRLAALSRIVLLASRYTPAWVLGTTGLSAAKIIENMEIGHNVMHGQWDWMNDPYIHSSTWDWDTASPASSWKHSHNYVHHTYTNVIGKDKDVGYEIMRVDPQQDWHPVFILQPLYNLLLAAFFEWGVAVHDLDIEAIRAGTKDTSQLKDELKGIGRKGRRQVVKDYIAWPLISGVAMTAVELAVMAAFGQPARPRDARLTHRLRRRAAEAAGRGGAGGRLATALRPEPRGREVALIRRLRGDAAGDGGARLSEPRAALARLIERRSLREPFRSTLTADLTANFARNVWSYAIIFCGHFPDQAYTFTEEEAEDDSKGAWYVRQLIGAANIDGGDAFHFMSGNLSYQVEHHLYPDMPSSRYKEIAPRVKEICERYGLPYNTGPFRKQLGSVQRTILRLALPGGRPRPKAPPYRAPAGPNGDTAASPADEPSLPAFP